MHYWNDITVVVPVYNRREELRRCLDSLSRQSVLPAEVIVVDDGSTDGSAEAARSHPLKPVVLDGPHAGAAAARNVGLAAVKTGWTMFFDSDDIMERDHIKTARTTASTGNPELVGWDVTMRHIDGKERILPFETDDIAWHNIMHGSLATQRYMARTSLFRKAGGWNPDVSVWDDIELGARLLTLNPRIVKASDNNVVMLQSPVSISGIRWSDNIGRYDAALDAMARTLGDAHPDWPLLKKAILAADIARENPVDGKTIFRSIRPMTMALRLAYHYRRLGGRGAARLLRRFFS